jgi:hypothetical protein
MISRVIMAILFDCVFARDTIQDEHITLLIFQIDLADIVHEFPDAANTHLIHSIIQNTKGAPSSLSSTTSVNATAHVCMLIGDYRRVLRALIERPSTAA